MNAINTFDLAVVLSGRPFLSPSFNAFENYTAEYVRIEHNVLSNFPELEGLNIEEQKRRLSKAFPEIAKFAQWVGSRCNAGTMNFELIGSTKQLEEIRQVGRTYYGLADEAVVLD